MANLTIENLTKSIEFGDTQGLMGGGVSGGSEMSVIKEMRSQGMQLPEGADGAEGARENAKTFSEILRNSVDQVNTMQQQADTAVKELVAGRNKNIHETMLLIERADTSLKLMMQVRNKVLDAYREIMRMQV